MLVAAVSFASLIFATVPSLSLQQPHSRLVGIKSQQLTLILFEIKSELMMHDLFHFSFIYCDKYVYPSKLSSTELLVEVPDEASESDSPNSKLQGPGIKECKEALVLL